MNGVRNRNHGRSHNHADTRGGREPGPGLMPAVAETISVHHGALAYLLGINALRASEAAAVGIEDYRETRRGHRVPHLVGKAANHG